MKRRHFLWCGVTAVACPSSAQASSIAAIDAFEKSSGGHVGLYALNVRSGAELAWRADDRFVMCSTFKASLAACVLERVDRGQDHLETAVPYGAADMQDWHAPVAKAHLSTGRLSVGELCEAAVEQSDNTCANLLLARIGGPQALTAFWVRMGDRVTRLDDPEPDLNRTPPGGIANTTTPKAMAHVLRRLVLEDALSERSRELLTAWLIGCRTGDNRLRAGLPRRYRIGDKTGNNGKDAAGDIAVVWPTPETPIVVSAYTRGGAPTALQFEALFSGIGRAVAERLT